MLAPNPVSFVLAFLLLPLMYSTGLADYIIQSQRDSPPTAYGGFELPDESDWLGDVQTVVHPLEPTIDTGSSISIDHTNFFKRLPQEVDYYAGPMRLRSSSMSASAQNLSSFESWITGDSADAETLEGVSENFPPDIGDDPVVDEPHLFVELTAPKYARIENESQQTLVESRSLLEYESSITNETMSASGKVWGSVDVREWLYGIGDVESDTEAKSLAFYQVNETMDFVLDATLAATDDVSIKFELVGHDGLSANTFISQTANDGEKVRLEICGTLTPGGYTCRSKLTQQRRQRSNLLPMNPLCSRVSVNLTFRSLRFNRIQV